MHRAWRVTGTSTAVVGTIVAVPALESALQPTALGSTAAAVALLPLAAVLTLLWHRRRGGPVACRTDGHRLRWAVVLAAVLVTGPLVGTLIAADQRGIVVLPGPGALVDTGVPAWVEELVFRAVPLLVVLRWWRRRGRTHVPTGILVGVTVVSAALFTLAHGAASPLTALDRFTFALLASLVLIRTGRLVPAVALHVSSNLYWYLVRDLTTPAWLLIGSDLAITALLTGVLLVAVRRGSGPEAEPAAVSTTSSVDDAPASLRQQTLV